MGRYIEQEGEELRSLPCEQRSLNQLKAAGSPMAQRILRLLTNGALYSHEIAKRLKVHEQKIYYHMRRLEAAGLILEERREEISGASAKYYRLAAPAFAILLEEARPAATINATKEKDQKFLRPFISDGQADFLIVIGSPEAHGPEMVQARDGGYAIDLALFLGSFLSGQPEPVVKLDTEFTAEDWQRNLIIIGGPIVNTAAAKVNESLPIRFKDSKTIESRLSGETYENDQIGVIVKGKNPRAPKKQILFIAGRRQSGTKAAILAFLHHFNEVISGNSHAPDIVAHVVEGRDLDSDGIVDEVRFRE